MRHDAHYVEELSQHRPQQIGRMIPVDKLDPNPEQPRTEFGDLTELTASIAEKGVLEPLLVKPNRLTGRWMIIAGERRWRSAQRAGLKEVPCVEMEVDEGTVAEIALIENMQRKDLTVWEEADGLFRLTIVDEDHEGFAPFGWRAEHELGHQVLAVTCVIDRNACALREGWARHE